MMESLWNKIRQEIEENRKKELEIRSVIEKNVIEEQGFLGTLATILSYKLCDHFRSQEDLQVLFYNILNENVTIQEEFVTDLKTYYDRDFACETYLEVLLFSRGFQSVTAYRIARSFFLEGKKLTAKYFQNRIFEVYGVDIHPNARLGKGIVVDHGIGLVIGETAKVGDRAFIFHNVTLGGTGHEGGDRHPKIGKNVIIGAGATVLGNITIGDNVNIAAGSVVTKSVKPGYTVAGVPAKVIGEAKKLL